MKKNSFWALVYMSLSLISGFILPHLILRFYGSEVNGLVSSVNQFLQIFSFLELGIAGITTSSLFEPIFNRNWKKVNEVVSSATKFYSRLGLILVGYVLLLVFIYPVFSHEFDFGYTTIIILAIGSNMFAQYYFGRVDGCILQASQKIYILYIVQAITVAINIIMSYILMIFGYSIQYVKVMTALLYLLRPIVIRRYITTHYAINRKEKYETEPMKQKWNGIAQHISFVILQSTDMVLLTIFDSLVMVSVYSVYNLVQNGISTLSTALNEGPSLRLGLLYAENDMEKLSRFWVKYEWLYHVFTAIVMSCTLVLIVPFVLVYTQDIMDINYARPLFAGALTCANLFAILRLPYMAMIQATGRYKDTQHIFIIAALINIFLSLLLIQFFGIIGVAIGTLIAMFVQTSSLAMFVYDNIYSFDFKWKKSYLIIIAEVAFTYLICNLLNINITKNYFAWCILGVKVLIISCGICFLFQIIFFKKNTMEFCDHILQRLKGRLYAKKNI